MNANHGPRSETAFNLVQCKDRVQQPFAHQPHFRALVLRRVRPRPVQVTAAVSAVGALDGRLLAFVLPLATLTLIRWISTGRWRFGRAMNMLGWYWWPSETTVATTEYDGRARHSSRALLVRLRAGGEGEHGHHLLAARDPRRRRIAHALPSARNHHG